MLGAHILIAHLARLFQGRIHNRFHGVRQILPAYGSTLNNGKLLDNTVQFIAQATNRHLRFFSGWFL